MSDEKKPWRIREHGCFASYVDDRLRFATREEALAAAKEKTRYATMDTVEIFNETSDDPPERVR